MMRRLYKKRYSRIRNLVWTGLLVLLTVLWAGSCASTASPYREGDDASTPAASSDPSDSSDMFHEEDRREESGGISTGSHRAEDSGSSESAGDDRIAALDEAGPPLRPEVPRVDVIDSILATMTAEEKVGQLIMPAYLYDRNSQPVRRMTEELRILFEEVRPGGFLLFAPNIETPGQLRAFVEELQEASRIPLIVAVDQEGGVVRRVVPTDGMPATAIPSASRVGRAGDSELAHELALVMARELRSLGVTMNLAPVADVLTNPDNPVIGSRAYGSDPETVSVMVESTVRGLQSGGVSAAIKHFPGHGDTVEDSHEEMAVFPHDLQRLEQVEFEPFRRGIAAGSDAVLTGHISVPSVTGDYIPTTLSPQLTDGLLRRHMGFQGVIITDALTMAALTSYYPAREIPVRALHAGADILLRPVDPRGARDAIMNALESGEITEARVDQSVRRILELKLRRGLIEGVHAAGEEDDSQWSVVYSLPDGEPIFARSRRFTPRETTLGIPEHQAVVEEILRRSAR
jgi:beta-N-acetylhexosaminidase